MHASLGCRPMTVRSLSCYDQQQATVEASLHRNVALIDLSKGPGSQQYQTEHFTHTRVCVRVPVVWRPSIHVLNLYSVCNRPGVDNELIGNLRVRPALSIPRRAGVSCESNSHFRRSDGRYLPPFCSIINSHRTVQSHLVNSHAISHTPSWGTH